MGDDLDADYSKIFKFIGYQGEIFLLGAARPSGCSYKKFSRLSLSMVRSSNANRTNKTKINEVKCRFSFDILKGRIEYMSGARVAGWPSNGESREISQVLLLSCISKIRSLSKIPLNAHYVDNQLVVHFYVMHHTQYSRRALLITYTVTLERSSRAKKIIMEHHNEGAGSEDFNPNTTLLGNFFGEDTLNKKVKDAVESEGKLPLELHPMEDFQENHVSVGFYHAGHPLETIPGDILYKIIEDIEAFLDDVSEDQGRSYIKFVGNPQVHEAQGWMKMTCENMFTWKWLSTDAATKVLTPTTPWIIKILDSEEVFVKVTVKIPNPKRKLVATTMFKRFKASNAGLSIASWRYLGQRKVDDGKNILITLAVNKESVEYIFDIKKGELGYGLRSAVKFRRVGANSAVDAPLVQFIGFDD